MLETEAGPEIKTGDCEESTQIEGFFLRVQVQGRCLWTLGALVIVEVRRLGGSQWFRGMVRGCRHSNVT